MAWGRIGETVSKRREATLDELQRLADGTPQDAGLRDFVASVQPGDELAHESERNNHTSYARYVGRRKNGFTYFYTVSFGMS